MFPLLVFRCFINKEKLLIVFPFQFATVCTWQSIKSFSSEKINHRISLIGIGPSFINRDLIVVNKKIPLTLIFFLQSLTLFLQMIIEYAITKKILANFKLPNHVGLGGIQLEDHNRRTPLKKQSKWFLMTHLSNQKHMIKILVLWIGRNSYLFLRRDMEMILKNTVPWER